jgi:MFS family permease
MTTEEQQTGSASDARRTAPSLWGHRDFNKLWAGQSISVLGSELTTLALPLTAILALDANSRQIGLLEAARTVAVLVLMLFAGVVVDRVRRRPLMVWTDFGRAVFIGLVPLLAFVGHLSMAVLYLTSVVVGALQVLFDLSRYAYMPTLVTGEQLVAANSRMQATESLGGIVGSSLGGFLTTIFRPAYVLLGDAVSFVVSAVSLLLIKQPEPPLQAEPDPTRGLVRRTFAEIGQGIKVTYTNRYVAPLAFNSAGANFGAMVILTLFILYANRQLHLSPTWIGIIYAAGSAGGVVGAVATTWCIRRFGFGRAMVGAMIVYRSLVLTPFVHGPWWLLVTLFSIIWFLTVFGVVMSNVAQGTLQQYVVPRNMLGRVFAAARALGLGVVPVAALVAGFLGQQIGLHNTILVGALIMPLPLLWVIFSPVSRLKAVTDAPAGNLDSDTAGTEETTTA